MNIKLTLMRFACCMILQLLSQAGYAAEYLQDGLGPTTTGRVQIRLVISHEVSAGIVMTNLHNLESRDTEYKAQLSSQIIDNLQRDPNAIIPFCVKSSSGGYFNVSSYEIPGKAENWIVSENGDSYPVNISFGEEEKGSVGFRAVENICSENDSIPVNVKMETQLGDELGSRYVGRFNVLVISE